MDSIAFLKSKYDFWNISGPKRVQTRDCVWVSSISRSQGTKAQWIPKEFPSIMDRKSRTISRGRCQEREQDIETPNQNIPLLWTRSLGDTGARGDFLRSLTKNGCPYTLDSRRPSWPDPHMTPCPYHHCLTCWPSNASLFLIIMMKVMPWECFQCTLYIKCSYPQSLALSLA